MSSTSWWNSSHRLTYLFIGIKHFVKPSRVYRLAHGRHLSETDKLILKELVKKKIIRGHEEN
jgi:hypothetical protein